MHVQCNAPSIPELKQQLYYIHFMSQIFSKVRVSWQRGAHTARLGGEQNDPASGAPWLLRRLRQLPWSRDHRSPSSLSQRSAGNRWRLKSLISAVTWGRTGGGTRQRLMDNAERVLQPVGNLSTPPRLPVQNKSQQMQFLAVNISLSARSSCAHFG